MHQESISACVNLALFFGRALGAVVGAEGKARSSGIEGGGRVVGADGKSGVEELRSSSDSELRRSPADLAGGWGDSEIGCCIASALSWLLSAVRSSSICCKELAASASSSGSSARPLLGIP